MQIGDKTSQNAEQNSELRDMLKALERLTAKIGGSAKSMLTLEEAAAYMGLKESSLLTLTSTEQIPTTSPTAS